MAVEYKPFKANLNGNIEIPDFKPIDTGIQKPLATNNCNCCCGGSEGSGDIYTIVKQLQDDRENFMKEIRESLDSFKQQATEQINSVKNSLNDRIGNDTIYFPFTVTLGLQANQIAVNLFSAGTVKNWLGLPQSALVDGSTTTILVSGGDRKQLDQTFNCNYQPDENVSGGGFWVLNLTKVLPSYRLVRISGLIVYNVVRKGL